ncbi:MAG: hypothetical protein M1837_000474 [Sclerophora amabilis]|nr:MAG: hypothetical protein M1837_000474 [Sclerophora amabilis]
MSLRLIFCLVACLVAATHATKPDYAERNLKTISDIYDITVYPRNVPIIVNGSAAVPPGLFNEKAVGRVSPVGNFSGFEDSIEYFFSLAPVPQSNPRAAAIVKAEVVEFSSACPEVAASLVWLYTGVVDENSDKKDENFAVLKQMAFWRFDEEGRVLKYDAIIPNLSAWRDTFFGDLASDPAVQAESIQQICGAAQRRCTGANAQYDNVEDCISELSQKPVGVFSEAWGDTVVCRAIHIILTEARPDVHCAHVGPDGGGKCIDTSYAAKYTDDESLFGEPVGTTFKCP